MDLLSRNKDKRRKNWPYAQDSTGRPRGTLNLGLAVGRVLVFEAIGRAREEYTKLGEEVVKHLNDHSDKLQDSGSCVVLSLFMMGKSAERSKPMVMLVSDDADARTEAFRLIKKSDILKSYPGFGIGHMDLKAEYENLQPLGANDLSGRDKPVEQQRTPSRPPIVRRYERSSPRMFVPTPLDRSSNHELWHSLHHTRQSSSNLAGRQSSNQLQVFVDRKGPLKSKRLLVKDLDGNTRLATIGGLISHNGKYYLASVSHALDHRLSAASPSRQSPVPISCPAVASVDCEVTGASDFEEFEDDDDELVEITSRGSITPESTPSECGTVENDCMSTFSSESDITLAQSSGRRTVEGDESIAELDAILNRYELPSGASPQSPNLNDMVELRQTPVMLPEVDFSLLPVSKSFLRKLRARPRYYVPRAVPLEEYTRYVEVGPRDAAVQIRTSNYTITGILSGTPSIVRLPHSREFRQVYVAKMNAPLAAGDCGAWVRDAISGNIFGHVVAGSPTTGLVLLIPATNAFKAAERALALESKTASVVAVRTTTAEPQQRHDSHLRDRSVWLPPRTISPKSPLVSMSHLDTAARSRPKDPDLKDPDIKVLVAENSQNDPTGKQASTCRDSGTPITYNESNKAFSDWNVSDHFTMPLEKMQDVPKVRRCNFAELKNRYPVLGEGIYAVNVLDAMKYLYEEIDKEVKYRIKLRELYPQTPLPPITEDKVLINAARIKNTCLRPISRVQSREEIPYELRIQLRELLDWLAKFTPKWHNSPHAWSQFFDLTVLYEKIILKLKEVEDWKLDLQYLTSRGPSLSLLRFLEFRAVLSFNFLQPSSEDSENNKYIYTSGDWDIIPARCGTEELFNTGAFSKSAIYGGCDEDLSFWKRPPSMFDQRSSYRSSVDYRRFYGPFSNDFSSLSRFTLDASRKALRDTVLGKEYLHYEEVVRQDIKAANTVGTPAFFAPELCYTDSYTSRRLNRNDMWSLGKLIHRLNFGPDGSHKSPSESWSHSHDWTEIYDFLLANSHAKGCWRTENKELSGGIAQNFRQSCVDSIDPNRWSRLSLANLTHLEWEGVRAIDFSYRLWRPEKTIWTFLEEYRLSLDHRMRLSTLYPLNMAWPAPMNTKSLPSSSALSGGIVTARATADPPDNHLYIHIP